MQENKNLFRGICTEREMYNSWIYGNVDLESIITTIAARRRSKDGRNRGVALQRFELTSLGQFTGLIDDRVSVDLNGNPFPAGEQIFEDDICVYACRTETQIGVVVWNTDYLWFELQFETGNSISFLDIAKKRKKYGINVQVRKIGDRFENPDLCPWFNDKKDYQHFSYRGFGKSGWITGSFVDTVNKDKVILCKNGRAKEVLAKSLGQETGRYDDSGAFVHMFENDILLVEFASSIVKYMNLTYDSSVAAYILTESTSSKKYSFGTIQKMKEQGEVLGIKVVGNTHFGLYNKAQKHR